MKFIKFIIHYFIPYIILSILILQGIFSSPSPKCQNFCFVLFSFRKLVCPPRSKDLHLVYFPEKMLIGYSSCFGGNTSQKRLKTRRAYLGSQFEGRQSVTIREARQQECQEVPHRASLVKKQRGVCWYSAHCLLCISLRLQSVRWQIENLPS